MLRLWWPFFVMAAVAAADRATKYLIETRVNPWDTIRVVPGLFQIIHTRNSGIAFGMLSETGSNTMLIVFSILILLFVGWMLASACRQPGKEHWTMRAALGLVLGGALGNLYDRIAFGSVTDFLDFYTGHSHFPIFNLADSAITCGAALLLVNLWWVRQPQGSEARAQSKP